MQSASTDTPTTLQRALKDVAARTSGEGNASESSKRLNQPLDAGAAPTNADKRGGKHPFMHLVAGGVAGFVESSVCHPLDTIKTRRQLQEQSSTTESVRARASLTESATFQRTSARAFGTISSSSANRATATPACPLKQPPCVRIYPTANMGTIGTARQIINAEGFVALYKGLTAVYTGIIPKMAIRFLSFEQYREGLQKLSGGAPPGMPPGQFTPTVNFFAGLFAGLTEAILVVTPSEVCKIRMQSQYSSMVDPSQLRHRKYTNVAQTALTIVREEGLGALYKGVVPTMLRQGCNQAVNFTTYNYFKKTVIAWRKERGQPAELLHWQSLLLGGISGGFGPMVNNPLDVVKTRMQKQVVHPGKTPKYTGLLQSCVVIAKEEGYAALWKGITPRLLRIMPGQAITFMTYEFVSSCLHKHGVFVSDEGKC